MQTGNQNFSRNLHMYIPLLDEEFDDFTTVNTGPKLPDLVLSPRADLSEWFE